VVDDRDFQKRVQKIGELVHDLETTADPAVRASAQELVKLLMDLHGAGLERLLEVVFQAGEPGARIIDDLGRDPLVSSLLILYGLHPEELPARVENKLHQIQSKLHKMGAEASLVAADGGDIRVRISVEGHACGSTGRTAQAIVEEAVYEVAPDLKSLVVEGLDEPAASGFIAIEKLIGAHPTAASTLHDAAPMRSDGMD
jgi:Fe-S cluster biogenesis protein NfuA